MIKEILKNQKIDYFILPNFDEFFLEYLPDNEKRVQYISGFTGSNATIIFCKGRNKFFTDGRYIIQAKNELNLKNYEIFNIAQKPVFSWLKENIKKNDIVAIDTKIVNVNFINNLKKIIDDNAAKLVYLDQNPVDKLWKNRPKKTNSKIFFHDIKYSGLDSQSKRNLVFKGSIADAILFTSPESICWLLNIRASDTQYSPLLASYAILYKNKKVDLFVDKRRFEADIKDNINCVNPDLLENKLIQIAKKYKKIQLDPIATNFWLYNIIEKNNFDIIKKTDPCLVLKACKNKTEIEGSIAAHINDGLAVTRFLYWLDKNIAKANIDELLCEKKLLEFRQKNPDFLYPSFNSISSYASNGAVVHYRSSIKTNKKLKGDSLYLIDSGGQYFQGTTDVTRTIAVGNPSQEMIDNFTYVLQGHINLACAKFPRGTTGVQLDTLARMALWQQGKDYDHGTGHGVGSFLSVHEGPCSISKRSFSQPLLEGMILSNEPGYYKENAYGIRIENLVLVEKNDADFLQLRTLTMVPIDPKLINFKILDFAQKKWLYEYHKNINFVLKSKLKNDEKAYLALLCDIYKKFIKN